MTLEGIYLKSQNKFAISLSQRQLKSFESESLFFVLEEYISVYH